MALVNCKATLTHHIRQQWNNMARSHYSKIYWVSLSKQNINLTGSSHYWMTRMLFVLILKNHKNKYFFQYFVLLQRNPPDFSLESFPKGFLLQFFLTMFLTLKQHVNVKCVFLSASEWTSKWWEVPKRVANSLPHTEGEAVQMSWMGCWERNIIQGDNSSKTAGRLMIKMWRCYPCREKSDDVLGKRNLLYVSLPGGMNCSFPKG